MQEMWHNMWKDVKIYEKVWKVWKNAQTSPTRAVAFELGQDWTLTGLGTRKAVEPAARQPPNMPKTSRAPPQQVTGVGLKPQAQPAPQNGRRQIEV